jgi:hypothetical protein
MKAPSQFGMASQMENVDADIIRITSTLHRSCRYVGVVIEGAVDRIRDNSENPEVRYHALEWKTFGIPAAHNAAFQPDPVVGYMDLFAYIIQMRDYFSDGAGSEYFREWQPIAIKACDTLVYYMRDNAERLSKSGDISPLENELVRWAGDHPLEENLYVRRNVTDFLDSLILKTEFDMSLMLGSMVKSMVDLNGRMSIMAEHMPKQMRWQGEMLLESGMITRQDLDKFMGSVESAVTTLDTLVTTSPALANALLDSLYIKMNTLLLSVDDQRVATLDVLAQERAIITDFIGLQREIVEREFGVLADSVVLEFWNRGQETIDRLVIQLAVAGSILAVVAFLCGLAFGRIFRR